MQERHQRSVTRPTVSAWQRPVARAVAGRVGSGGRRRRPAPCVELRLASGTSVGAAAVPRTSASRRSAPSRSARARSAPRRSARSAARPAGRRAPGPGRAGRRRPGRPASAGPGRAAGRSPRAARRSPRPGSRRGRRSAASTGSAWVRASSSSRARAGGGRRARGASTSREVREHLVQLPHHRQHGRHLAEVVVVAPRRAAVRHLRDLLPGAEAVERPRTRPARLAQESWIAAAVVGRRGGGRPRRRPCRSRTRPRARNGSSTQHRPKQLPQSATSSGTLRAQHRPHRRTVVTSCSRAAIARATGGREEVSDDGRLARRRRLAASSGRSRSSPASIGWLINWTGLVMLFSPVRFHGVTRARAARAVVGAAPQAAGGARPACRAASAGRASSPPAPPRWARSPSTRRSPSSARRRSSTSSSSPTGSPSTSSSCSARSCPTLIDEVMRDEHPALWRDLPPAGRRAVDRAGARAAARRRHARSPTEIGNHIDQLLDPKIMVIEQFRRRTPRWWSGSSATSASASST